MKFADFTTKTEFNKQELLGLAYGNLVEDPPSVDWLALPAPPMLMIDRVLEVDKSARGGKIVAERDVQLDDWFFHCHFRTDPVQPGCLGLDAIWQLIGLFLGVSGARGTGRALGAGEIEFFGQIRPYNKIVRYEVTIRRLQELSSRGAFIAIGDGTVLVDGNPIYAIHAAKVGTFPEIRYPDYPFRSRNSVGGRLT